jgi:hypothetical protein
MNRVLSVIAGVAASAACCDAQVRITEFMYTGYGGEYIELTNVGQEPIDVSGWSVDDSGRHPGSFALGALGLIAPGESVVLTESSPQAFTDDWKLTPATRVLGMMRFVAGDGLGRNDEINVFDAGGILVDRITFGDQTISGSLRARYYGAWCAQPALGLNSILAWQLAATGDIQTSWRALAGDIGSPGTYTAGSVPPRLGMPVFSLQQGYYNGPIALTITPAAGPAEIRYTLDGSTPTESSPQLSGELTLDSSAGDPNSWSLIRTCPPEIWLPPLAEVFKVSVVRAVAVRAGALTSEAATQTFIIGPQGATRFPLAVVSIATDEDNFWGYENGIYVPGRIYDMNYDPAIPPLNRVANYTQDGAAWERPVHLEFFDPDGSLVFSTGMGARINGNISRAMAQKSLRLYADSAYGLSQLPFALFGDLAPSMHKRLILRNSGNDNPRAFCRDDLLQSLAAGAGVDTQASRFVVVFINGEYWGVHSMRERYDKYYLQFTHGADPDNIDFLEGYGLLPIAIKEGDNAHYSAMISYMHSHDMRLDASIAQLDTMMDIDNFITYFAQEIYSANYDWPNNNIEYWRPRTPGGRWQWLLKDTDLGMNWGMLSTAPTDSLARLLNDTTWATDIFRTLMTHRATREAFINREADLLNTYFAPARVHGRVDAYRAMLGPVMPEHIARWSLPSSMETWSHQMDVINQFGQERPAFVRQHFAAGFGLEGTADVRIEADPRALAAATLNSIELLRWGLPFEGTYFRGIPVTLNVTPAEGFCLLGFGGQRTTGSEITFDPALTSLVRVDLVRSPDFNRDGGVDGSDVFDFFPAWEAGSDAADINLDGGVDGLDVDLYFQLWEAGGC